MILVRAPNWIGDQILAYPFYYYLRKLYPQKKIVVVGPEWIQSIHFMDLIDEAIVLERPSSTSWMDRVLALRLSAKKLKEQFKESIELAYALPNSFSSALFLYLCGASSRRGYQADGRSFLLTQKLPWDSSPQRHRAQAYLDLLPHSPFFKPLEARSFWEKNNEGFNPEKSWPLKESEILLPPQEPYWVLAPGATAESRRWPEDRFLLLAKLIYKELGIRGVIVGGPKEAVLSERLAQNSQGALLDFSARCGVSGLWKVFRNARFSICNESGLAHVASLCGKPNQVVQIVCGAANPLRTQPLGPTRVLVAVNPVDCWPCEQNECVLPEPQKIKCLKGIEISQVWMSLNEELKKL